MVNSFDFCVCIIVDGNIVVVLVVYCCNELCLIYLIILFFLMVEIVDEWFVVGCKNIWGDIFIVMEMQFEGGVVGVIYGVLQGGVLSIIFMVF